MKETVVARAIDHHIVIILVQVGWNIAEDLLPDGISRINIITVDLRKQLGLLTPKPTPYNL